MNTPREGAVKNVFSATRRNFYDVFLKTITDQRLPSNSSSTENILCQSLVENYSTDNKIQSSSNESPSKGKHAYHMAKLRSENPEYRRTERERNAQAMAKLRLENPIYRQQERQRNRIAMAKLRSNPLYRQQERIRNAQAMALKRSGSITNKAMVVHDSPEIKPYHFQVLETNLNSSHISFIPYKDSLIQASETCCTQDKTSRHALEMARLRSNPEYRQQERIRNAAAMALKRQIDPLYGKKNRRRRKQIEEEEQRRECEVLTRVDIYCRQSTAV
ncbi:unnamed protein product [Didymodactylos carnosus]|uniref:Uncharacterized protein n=1 Tax=Didymodactylos carnosus TaxID=1234261 RepID=A0A813YQQ1_9BILA|nr:unnamed protein product [Didymodactylos carnosus]CAF0887632.1 unnamed protein product [Didymodactylos carnosus]CAF3525017.1 unnamed protein product [Didymodactylos carnosus]CAF3672568.1 unnamed protein product [Didymodactylos carnosus]